MPEILGVGVDLIVLGLLAALFVVALIAGIVDARQYVRFTHEDPTIVAIDSTKLGYGPAEKVDLVGPERRTIT